MSHPAHALVVVALPAEARPLIDHWRLKRDADSHAFPLYCSSANSTTPVSLIVSGIGKQNTAAACAHLYNGRKPRSNVWLNTGIAGHASQALGTTLICHCCEDASSGRRHYPPLLFNSACDSTNLITVDHVSEHYPENAAVDMEASAYFQIATKYTTAELVQSIKVISDNTASGIDHVDANKASDWVSSAIPSIEHTIDQLRQLSSQLPAPDTPLPHPLSTLRLTVSQRNQVITLLQRWQAISNGATLPTAGFTPTMKSRDAIAALRDIVDAQAIHYP